jgi:hypothetical protein
MGHTNLTAQGLTSLTSPNKAGMTPAAPSAPETMGDTNLTAQGLTSLATLTSMASVSSPIKASKTSAVNRHVALVSTRTGHGGRPTVYPNMYDHKATPAISAWPVCCAASAGLLQQCVCDCAGPRVGQVESRFRAEDIALQYCEGSQGCLTGLAVPHVWSAAWSAACECLGPVCLSAANICSVCTLSSGVVGCACMREAVLLPCLHCSAAWGALNTCGLYSRLLLSVEPSKALASRGRSGSVGCVVVRGPRHAGLSVWTLVPSLSSEATACLARGCLACVSDSRCHSGSIWLPCCGSHCVPVSCSKSFEPLLSLAAQGISCEHRRVQCVGSVSKPIATLPVVDAAVSLAPSAALQGADVCLWLVKRLALCDHMSLVHAWDCSTVKTARPVCFDAASSGWVALCMCLTRLPDLYWRCAGGFARTGIVTALGTAVHWCRRVFIVGGEAPWLPHTTRHALYPPPKCMLTAGGLTVLCASPCLSLCPWQGCLVVNGIAVCWCIQQPVLRRHASTTSGWLGPGVQAAVCRVGCMRACTGQRLLLRYKLPAGVPASHVTVWLLQSNFHKMSYCPHRDCHNPVSDRCARKPQLPVLASKVLFSCVLSGCTPFSSPTLSQERHSLSLAGPKPINHA